jgi:hypothetical protein
VGKLPARVVLEYNEAKSTYRTFLEIFPNSGEAGFQYGRFFKTEGEAVWDFKNRVGRL